MFKDVLIANQHFLPGTGRGTALAVEGPVEAHLILSKWRPAALGTSVSPSDCNLPVAGRNWRI